MVDQLAEARRRRRAGRRPRPRARRRRSRPTSAAIARAVAGWSPVIIATLDARLAGRRRSRRVPRPRRVLERHQAEQLERALGLVGRPGHRPRRRACRTAIASTRRPRSASARQRRRPRPGTAAHSGQHRVGRALDQHLGRRRPPTCVGAGCRTGSGRGPARRAPVVVDVDPDAQAGGVQRGLHRVAARDPPAVDLAPTRPGRAPRCGRRSSRRRSSTALGRRRSGPRRRARSPARRSSADPTGIHTSTTVISLRVSVPVLSVQMNVVEPSVSTASRWRTSAWRPAMRWAPVGQRQRDGRQEPARHHRDGHADGEEEAVRRRHARAARRHRRSPTPIGDGDHGDDPRHAVELDGAAASAGGRCGAGQARDAGQPRVRAGGDDHGHVPRPRPRSSRRGPSSPADGMRRGALAGQRRRSTARLWASSSSQVGRDAIALAQHHEVADAPGPRREISARAPSRTTVTRRGSRSRSRSEACSARCSWANAKHAVQHDDDEHRDAELRHARRRTRARRPPRTAGRRSGPSPRRAAARPGPVGGVRQHGSVRRSPGARPLRPTVRPLVEPVHRSSVVRERSAAPVAEPTVAPRTGGDRHSTAMRQQHRAARGGGMATRSGHGRPRRPVTDRCAAPARSGPSHRRPVRPGRRRRRGCGPAPSC